jgi:hypothetical protein
MIVHASGKRERAVAPKLVRPDTAIEAFGGWLLGSNRGEWGGELAFKPADGPAVLLLEDNVIDIARMGSRFVAVTGIAHLNVSGASVYEIRVETDGTPLIQKRQSLPTPPKSVRVLLNGDLLLVFESYPTWQVDGTTFIEFQRKFLRLDQSFALTPFDCKWEGHAG